MAQVHERGCEMKEYNEHVVETLDDAGCIIANKNIIRRSEMELLDDTFDKIRDAIRFVRDNGTNTCNSETWKKHCEEYDSLKRESYSIQEEIESLRERVANLEQENEALRRIHKESIDILVKELSDKDYEYNQKTNRLIERHAEQLNRCDAEVKRLTGRKDGEVPNY
jgi:predicted  nucleic acid-binding Zn-ribbon protein